MPEQVILLCPCCASVLDAEAAPTAQEFMCLSCGQTWVMVVDHDRQAAHSLT